MSLELAAMRWLWLEQNCMVVLEQRTPVYGMGLPDVLGITKGRWMTEIEIKRSASDFAADFKKTHRITQGRELLRTHQPRQFYYMMPRPLADRLAPRIPDWAGLMSINTAGNEAEVIKRAPVNDQSKKLTILQCVRLARMMTNHMMGYAIANNSIKEQWRHGENFSFTEWVDCRKGMY